MHERTEAQLAGNLTYRSQCRNGHAEKYASNGKCVCCDHLFKERAARTPHRLPREQLEVLARLNFGLSIVNAPRYLVESLKRRCCLTDHLQITESGMKALSNAKRKANTSAISAN